MKNFVDWYIGYIFEQDERVITKDEAIEWLQSDFDHLVKDGIHAGDCTHENHSCNICYFEILLNNYYEYMKKEKF